MACHSVCAGYGVTLRLVGDIDGPLVSNPASFGY